MPTFSYDSDSFPSEKEFLQRLRESSEQNDPVDDLLALERELYELERQHGIASARFFADFQAGKTDDSVQSVTWAAKYRLYLNLKAAISNSLKRVVSESATPG